MFDTSCMVTSKQTRCMIISCATKDCGLPNFWTIFLRACLHGGGGPQVGEITCLGGVTRLSIKSLILSWSRLHERWSNLLRRVARPGLPGRITLSAGVIICHLNVSRWGNPPSRGRDHVTSASAPNLNYNIMAICAYKPGELFRRLYWCLAVDFTEEFGPEAVAEPVKFLKEMNETEYKAFKKKRDDERSCIKKG